MKRNNKGFTLVELIVSIAILSLVALSAASFMVAGSRVYSSLNYTMRLQYESQLAMAQLQEYLVDCSTGLAWDDTENTLYIVDHDESTPHGTLYMFHYDSTDQRIYFDTATVADTEDGTRSYTDDNLMAEHVTGLSLEFEGSQVAVQLQMQRSNKTYNAKQIIALRNHPAHYGNWDDLKAAALST